jgi:prepilin-type N-terminal cleavage/methylation domain-containing protein
MVKFRGQNGVTLVEMLIVVALVAVLATALYPLISTTYESWRTADRRSELLQVGRVGMDKMARELRRAYDLNDTSNPLYIDIYPDWAPSTPFRFNYDNTSNMQIEFGTSTPVFVRDSLAAPIDSFTYKTYTRRLEPNWVSFRRVNAFIVKFTVSDERQILPPTAALNLNPMTFYDQVQMRVSREGYVFSRDNTYATETYYYDRSANDSLCIKAFCDRVTPTIFAPPGPVGGNIITKTATIALLAGGFSITYNMTYDPANDIYTVCPINSALFTKPAVRITITIADNDGETCTFEDTIEVHP